MLAVCKTSHHCREEYARFESEFIEFGPPEFTEHYVVSPPSSGCMDIHRGTLVLKSFYNLHVVILTHYITQFDRWSCCISVQSESFQAPLTQPEAQSFLAVQGCVYSLFLVLESSSWLLTPPWAGAITLVSWKYEFRDRFYRNQLYSIQ